MKSLLKLTFLGLIFFGVDIVSIAQEVRVLYHQKRKTDYEQLKKELPPKVVSLLLSRKEEEEKSFYAFELLIQKNQSLYQKATKEHQMVFGSNYHITFQGENDIVYKNLKQHQLTGKTTVASRKFHIKDTLPLINWNLQEGQKKILGYDCFKAITTLCSYKDTITAWYTMDIPVSNGPLEFGGLPGLILSIETGAKTRLILEAKEVDIKKQHTNNLIIPSLKKTITYDDFCDKKQQNIKRRIQAKTWRPNKASN